MRHEWTDPERGRVYAVENGNFYELEPKGPRLIEGRQVSNREILRLAERERRLRKAARKLLTLASDDFDSPEFWGAVEDLGALLEEE